MPGSRIRFSFFAAVAAAVAAAFVAISVFGGGAAPTAVTPAVANEGVTVEDREAAIAAYIACVESRGYKAWVTPGAGLRPTRATFDVRPVAAQPDKDAIDGAQDAFADCNRQFLRETDDAYQEQHPVTANAVDEMYRMLEACVTSPPSMLIAVPGTSIGAIYSASNSPLPIIPDDVDQRVLATCKALVEAETGLIPPP